MRRWVGRMVVLVGSHPDEFQFHHQGNDWWICRGRRSHLSKFRTWRWYANNGNFDRVPIFKSQFICN